MRWRDRFPSSTIFQNKLAVAVSWTPCMDTLQGASKLTQGADIGDHQSRDCSLMASTYKHSIRGTQMLILRALGSAVLSVAVLSACGGGDGSTEMAAVLPSPPPGSNPTPNPSPAPSPSPSPAVAPCVSFKEVNATVVTRVDNTVTMSVANPNNAIDGSLTTPATLTVNGSTGPTQGVAIRATAQNGIAFPAGKTAGAFYSVPSGTAQTYTVTIRTLLGNSSIQESNASDNSGGGSGVSGGHPSRFTGIVTTKPFDAVEVVVSNTQSEPMPRFEVFEICSDHSE